MYFFINYVFLNSAPFVSFLNFLIISVVGDFWLYHYVFLCIAIYFLILLI